MSGRRGIDHVVLPVADLEAARRAYRTLGFTLTPRARHPFGTDNSLVQLDGCFLELLSVERPPEIPATTRTRFSFAAFNRDFLARREGVSMLVFESRDADADQAEFEAAGLRTWEPASFERQAALPDGDEVTVGFSLRFVTDPGMPEAAFFSCRQSAPEHFWKPDYQRHGNGARTIAEVVMAADDPLAAAPLFAGLQGPDAVHETPDGLAVETPRGGVSVLTPAALERRFGCPPPGDPQGAHFVGCLVGVADLERADYLLREADLPLRLAEGALLVAPAHTFGCLLGFVDIAAGTGPSHAR